MRLAALVLTTALSSRAAAQAPAVRTVPERLVNGDAFLVTVTPSGDWRSLAGTFDGRPLVFDRTAADAFTAFAGVDFDAAPGDHALALTAADAAGGRPSFQVPLRVAHAERPKSRLSVPKRYVEPDARTRARILRDQVVKRERLSAVTPAPLLDGGFAPPVAVPTSEVYGVERVFNGRKESVHLGLDYRAPPGTPVLAANAGRVLLARDLFFEGRCVALDHGRGLVTLYLHLSRLDVKEGERVAKGARLGLSGASGRATGPHLHLAVRWRGIYLDPASLLALPLP